MTMQTFDCDAVATLLARGGAEAVQTPRPPGAARFGFDGRWNARPERGFLSGRQPRPD
ncbi:hypothetical protein [uncultured Albimonas sp.]|uniref:hypothetical protein n=1 Tax=uncultured Albimonas sp. TaxID=1331701 RepID=UPI0030EEA2CA|tara:strand:+ start:4028 stop:4201 length:174 start_codon:yes stop_codon:yes gene_type:complete